MVAILYQSNTVGAMKFAGDRSIVRKEDAPLRCGRGAAKTASGGGPVRHYARRAIRATA
jgi:hypothetical protein